MNQMPLFDVAPKPAPQLGRVPVVVFGGRPEVRYRNPGDAAQAWTGRGKPPRWVTDWIEGGKSLDALRVPGERP